MFFELYRIYTKLQAKRLLLEKTIIFQKLLSFKVQILSIFVYCGNVLKQINKQTRIVHDNI